MNIPMQVWCQLPIHNPKAQCGLSPVLRLGISREAQTIPCTIPLVEKAGVSLISQFPPFPSKKITEFCLKIHAIKNPLNPTNQPWASSLHRMVWAGKRMHWAPFGKSEIKGLGEVTTPILMSHFCDFLVTLCRYLIQLMLISSHNITEERVQGPLHRAQFQAGFFSISFSHRRET